MISKNRTSIVYNSLAVAVIINAQFVAYVANAYFGISGGLVTLLYIVSFVLTIAGSFFNDFKLVLSFSKRCCMLAGYLIIVFGFSFLVTSGFYTMDYFMDFIATGLVTLYIIQSKFDRELVLRFNMTLGLLFCLNPNRYVSSALLNISYERASMFASYILIPIILSAIYHFVFYREKKFVLILLYFANAFVLVRTLSILGRGPLLSIFIGIMISLVIKNNKKWGNCPDKRKMMYIAIVIVTFIAIANIGEIIFLLNTFLTSNDIHIAAVTKSMDLLSARGISGLLNNRDDRWIWTFELIRKSPIFGNGIGEYANVYGTWSHNIILQLVVEMGLLGCLPIICTMIYILYYIFLKNLQMDNLILLCFLCSISLPRLMLSSYLWHHPEFWMFVYFGLIAIEQGKKKNHIRKNREG